MALTPGTRQTRRLDRHHPNPALAHGVEKCVKAGTVNVSAGNAQIVIDYLDVTELALVRMVRKRVLKTLTLDMVLSFGVARTKTRQ